MRRNIVIGAVLTLVVVFLAYVLLRPAGVTVGEVNTGPAALFVYASGQVIPEEKITLRSKNVARIARFLVTEGQSVKQGDVLVVLEGQESTAQLATARAELAQAQTDYEYKKRELDRIKQLYDQQAVSQRDYDNTLTAFRSAENAVRRATANVEGFSARSGDYTLISPFDGVVLEKILDAGAMVTNTDGIISLGAGQTLLIEGKVDELDADKVKQGQKVLISFDSLKDKVYEGTVRLIAPRIDYATKSFKIKIDVPQTIPLRSGMSAELNILVQEKPQALLIPAAALDVDSVRLVENGKVVLRKVKTGLRDSRKIEITEGLRPGDLVVVKPTGLGDGTRVRVTARE
jgi:RND family efflux transporter MFP subunit